jgi:hypothetical protein
VANLGVENLGDRVRARLNSISPDPRLQGSVNRMLTRAIAEAGAAARSQCLIPGCTAPSIRSHVIPDGFLQHLASSEAPLTPTYDRQGLGAVRRMSGSTTPRFPGYCGHRHEDHDRTLFLWERTRRFPVNDDTAVRRQLMRAADARIHELAVRRDLLARVVRAARGELVEVARDSMTPSERRQWHDAISTFALAVEGASSLLLDLRALVSNLRDPDSSDDRAVTYCVALHTRVSPLASLVDAAWLPRTLDNLRDRAPVVVSVLADDVATHLLIGTTSEGAATLAGIDRAISTADDLGAFIGHWMQWGSQYWYASSAYWDGFDPQTREVIERNLSLAPHAQTAVYSTSGHLRTPIIRPGSGWI